MDGGEIQRFGERSCKRHGSVGLMIEILRRPDAPVRELELDRRIIDERGGRIPAALERPEIYRGLHQRTDGPARIEGAIEDSGAVDFASSDDRDHIAAVG